VVKIDQTFCRVKGIMPVVNQRRIQEISSEMCSLLVELSTLLSSPTKLHEMSIEELAVIRKEASALADWARNWVD